MIKDILERFDELIKELNEKYKYCVAHCEGQFCHLDDEKDNDENIVPELKQFITEELKKAMVSVVPESPQEDRDYYQGYDACIDQINDNIDKIFKV